MVDFSNNVLPVGQIGLFLGRSTTSISVSVSKTTGGVSLKARLATHEYILSFMSPSL